MIAFKLPMKGFYQSAYRLVPTFLKRRINPLAFAIDEFVESMVVEPGAVVLDAGAGESRFGDHFNRCRYLALDATVGDAGWDYSGIDLIADLHAIPLASNSCDAAINTQVLEHLEDPGKVLSEICRVLRSGGLVHLTAPQGWHEHQQPNDFFRFTRFSLGKMLREAGFASFEIEPMGGYFIYLGQRLTYIPKILFESRRGWLRAALFPCEVTALFLFCVVCPLLCFYFDRLDSAREFTLGYRVRANK